jgi:uncharacterized membrane protein
VNPLCPFAPGGIRGVARRKTMTLYEFLKYIHIVLAIIAIGFNISYGIWLARAAQHAQHAPFILRTLKLLDDRFANPAYALLLLTGFGMIFEADIPIFDTFWITTSLGLYVALIVVGVLFYSPVLRRQTEIAESGMADSAEYRQLSKRNVAIGGLLVLLVLVIELLMVTKPML